MVRMCFGGVYEILVRTEIWFKGDRNLVQGSGIVGVEYIKCFK